MPELNHNPTQPESIASPSTPAPNITPVISAISPQRSRSQTWLRRLPAIFLLGVLSFLYLRRMTLKSPSTVQISSLHLVDLKGHPLPEATLQGKAILLNYWAPWCPPCRLEIPWLQQLQTANAHNLLVIGVVADDTQYKQAAAFMKQRGISYPLVRDTPSLDASFGAATGLPTTFYLTSTGKVVHAVRGLIPESLMRRYVNDANKG